MAIQSDMSQLVRICPLFFHNSVLTSSSHYLSMSYPILGIDLGTCCTCVYGFKNGQLLAVPFNGYNTIVSVIYINDGAMLYGEPAKMQIQTEPDHVIYDVKRFIGRNVNEIQQVINNKRYQFVIDSYDNRPIFCIPQKAGYYCYTAEHIDSYFLKYIVDCAAQYLEYKPEAVVITVPAFFQVSQIDATKQAAKMAGLNVVAVLFEPSAAAIASNIPITVDTRHGLIYDLGGGTFDVAIVETAGSNYDIIANSGHPFLGGSDFDGLIFNLIKEKLNNMGYNVDAWDKRKLGNLQKQTEEVKIELSTNDFSMVDLNTFGFEGDITITRDEFERVLRPWLDVTINICETTLKSARVTLGERDFILLVGGSSHIPLVRNLLQQAFPQIPVLNNVNPSEVVANGAAMHCLSLYCKSRGIINPIPCPVVHSIVVRAVWVQFNNNEPMLVLPVGTLCMTKKEMSYNVKFTGVTVKFYVESDEYNQDVTKARHEPAPKKLIASYHVRGFFTMISFSILMNIKGELEFEYTNQGNHKVAKAVINLQPDISPDKLTEYINRKALLTKCSKDIDGYYDQIKQSGKNNKATEEFYNKIQEWLKDPRVLKSTTESVIHTTCTNSVKYFYKILTQLFVC